jgi:hypothetical protein
MAERSARRLLGSPGWDAPSARAAWQAPQPPATHWGCSVRGFWTPLAFPLSIPLAFPPPQMAGATCPHSGASVLVKPPAGGQSAAKTAGDWPPLGEWCGRAARSASRD